MLFSSVTIIFASFIQRTREVRIWTHCLWNGCWFDTFDYLFLSHRDIIELKVGKSCYCFICYKFNFSDRVWLWQLTVCKGLLFNFRLLNSKWKLLLNLWKGNSISLRLLSNKQVNLIYKLNWVFIFTFIVNYFSCHSFPFKCYMPNRKSN